MKKCFKVTVSRNGVEEAVPLRGTDVDDVERKVKSLYGRPMFVSAVEISYETYHTLKAEAAARNPQPPPKPAEPEEVGQEKPKRVGFISRGFNAPVSGERPFAGLRAPKNT
jgi:hypothetical protein